MAKITSTNIIASTSNSPWEVAVEPFPITDQIYYVGNAWVGAYLIDTGDGLILLDTTTAETSYLLLHSIYRLGYRPEQIKLILLSHAHVDHFGSAQFMKELSHAKIYLSKEDEAFRHDPVASAVGRIPGINFREYDFDVDDYYDDSRRIALGTVEIQTMLTPGHTPGTTSFFIKAPDKSGKMLTAAMHGGVGVLTMSDEAFQQSGLSPELRKQFIRDCEQLKDCHVDICLPSHPAHAPLFEMRDKGWEQGNPFVDEACWSWFLESRVKFAREMEDRASH